MMTLNDVNGNFVSIMIMNTVDNTEYDDYNENYDD